MWFHVRRTSAYKSKPCEEAVERDYVRVDERSVRSPSNIPAHKGQDESWWYGEGRNHRVERNHICRDFDDKGWFVEINSLEELIAFREKHGTIILDTPLFQDKDGGLGIEIYDDYRE